MCTLSAQRSPDGQPSGLFKSRGQALEALQGAVYLEHGIQASSKLFEEGVLPHLDFGERMARALDAGVGAGAGAGAEPVAPLVEEGGQAQVQA